MRLSDKIRAAIVLTTMALAIFLVASCRKHSNPPTIETTIETTGEPETYTATIVRSIEDGEQSFVTETQVARSGDMRREEWTEKGERLALITRFDSGKSFLLKLSQQTYIETDLALNVTEKSKPTSVKGIQNSDDAEKPSPATGHQISAMDFVEDRFAEEPTSLETFALPDVYLASQLCKVVEKRAIFADGRTEVTKIFRAENLSRLAIRTERETSLSTQRLKVVTEWRDIKPDAAPDDFVVPVNFKKVQSFSAR